MSIFTCRLILELKIHTEEQTPSRYSSISNQLTTHETIKQSTFPSMIAYMLLMQKMLFQERGGEDGGGGV